MTAEGPLEPFVAEADTKEQRFVNKGYAAFYGPAMRHVLAVAQKSEIHAGGSNVTQDKCRRGMHVSYCLGWLRTEENNYLSLSLDRVRKLSRRAQTLLGYAAHDGLAMGLGYLGAVDLSDPVELFAQGKL